jgi:predicted aminopeptidase
MARNSKALGTCVLKDGRMNRDATLATLCSEMILLIFMLAGLLRQRDHYLGRLLFHHVSHHLMDHGLSKI